MDGFGYSPFARKAAYTEAVRADVPNYWRWAERYVLADRFFASVNGPSFPNHLFTIAAQSGGTHDNPRPDDESVIQAGSGYRKVWGCDARAGQTVDVVNEEGYISSVPPCFDFQTRGRPAERQGHPVGVLRGLRTSRRATSGPRTTPSGTSARPNEWQRAGVPDGPAHRRHRRRPPAAGDVDDAAVPALRPPASTRSAGARTGAEVINAIMRSPMWKDTAIFLTWDDWGGFYDHVPPAAGGRVRPGDPGPAPRRSRHTRRGLGRPHHGEFSSVLRFVETNWDLSRPHPARPLGERPVRGVRLHAGGAPRARSVAHGLRGAARWAGPIPGRERLTRAPGRSWPDPVASRRRVPESAEMAATTTSVKLERLHEMLSSTGGAVVAFSGGTDSALVAAVAARALGDRALAVTAVSPSLPPESFWRPARSRPWSAIATAPFARTRSNARATSPTEPTAATTARPSCTTGAGGRRRGGIPPGRGSGANVDDLGDWRPGLTAAAEHRVRIRSSGRVHQGRGSRRGARDWASRPGTSRRPPPVVAHRARSEDHRGGPVRVGRAERALKDLGFRQVRVRVHGEVARVRWNRRSSSGSPRRTSGMPW